MKRGEARNLIYQALGDMLSGTDFRFKRSAEGYVRPILADSRTSAYHSMTTIHGSSSLWS